MGREHRIDLKLLRYFIAVAEELHFGRAAVRLNMSQPPLSIHIKELEQQLGTLLFVRHSRSVALTHAGKVLMEESRRLIESTNQALARVEKIGRGESGRIELGVVGTAMWGRMRPMMHRFLKENPNVDVIFREKSPGLQMALLERRELDAGIWRMATALPERFSAQRLYEASFLVAMPEDHALAACDRVPLDALRNEYFVTLPSVHSDWAFLQIVCQKAGFTPMIVREVVEPQTVLAMISMGMGITLMADSYAQMNWPGVVFRPLEERIAADLYLVYEHQQVTPVLSKLIATFMQEGC
ncbi:TPA: LysR family transcriptional regulator [Kluyvera ascorbata]|uniref:LysR family transcriptional regulator n=1 Tax=Kluyvera genomosp. 2 TaxID=2774054 RepID=A0A2T2Y7T2_9ENTR|nr:MULTISPECIES: LysR family transcriptional regulator [Enterobacteriaceae]HAT3916694.1 LysR family transcriptional regulator [Kluyvera ascorbata]PSR48594.1 LysR family transcriptional regulator [Kluyvera genomosp. 2]BBQ82874.1 LysR family transcriptional regulator [Klebsiella sp. WP3-W18-ESBL-02]BBR19908.1 LysR family transcriptional regulator [Klebsiella sp. WP3-S18-ESBL-05]HAT3941607.1 LysR family transcriptional regulator [Kluyvera ascorbata]